MSHTNTNTAWPLALVMMGFLSGCSLLGLDDEEASAPTEAPATTCADREEGCACEHDGQELPCYADAEIEATELVCNVGKQTCRAGRWSTCEAMTEHRRDITADLIGEPTVCNPCNPSCFEAGDESIEDDELTDENSDNVLYDPVRGGVVSESVTTEDEESVGVGSDSPFDPDEPETEAEGVELDPEGAIVLTNDTDISDSIWIANTGEGTVSRFDTNTMLEVARYWVGPFGRNNDPSRTSINTAGDAFVAGRRGAFITKISGAKDSCPDQNGDGVITTSNSPTPLPWGTDECVIWTTDLRGVMPNGYIRAVAAQDIIDPVTGDVREYVWVGGYSDRRISLIDGTTGAILMTTYVQYRPYGFALDGSGNLWMSTLYDGRLVRIDTTRCNEDYCPWNAVCSESAYNRDACDGAIKQAIPLPANGRPYGVTVDAAQRVWLGGNVDVMRYDRSRPRWSRWTRSYIGTTGGWKAGIAVDGSGNAWTTGSGGTWRINTENPTQWHRMTSLRGWGVAIAADDRAWVIGRWDNKAWVVEPGAALNSNTVNETARTLVTPYTYSDMTGQQLRLAATPRGTYLATFEGCGTNTRWENLVFDVDTPPNTTVGFRVRTAATRAGLSTASWYGVGVAPTAASPLSVASVLDLAGVPHGAFAQLEIALGSSILDPTMFVTPRVRSVQLEHTCSIAEEGSYERTYDATVTCEIPPDRPYWNELQYAVDTPTDSKVEIIVRTSDDLATLPTSAPVMVSVPLLEDTGTIDLQALLSGAGMQTSGIYLNVKMRLLPSSEGISAALYQLKTRWECTPSE